MSKIRITIGIPAYNEETNIQSLLLSILEQEEKDFSIREIIIISDGSTDRTVEKVKEIKDKRIKLINSRKRIGKSQHLNNIFKLAKGNVIVLFDSDVILSNNLVIEHLIKPLSDRKVGLVGGNPIPRPGSNFVEKSINASFTPYKILRTKFKNGNNAYGCDGKILALSKKFSRSIHVPRDMIANDAYMYFACITKGFEFKHVQNANVWYRSPSTLSDHIRQNKRFIAARYRLKRIFGDVVSKEYAVPKVLLYRLLLNQLLRMPIHSIFIYAINIYINNKAKKEERAMNALWPMANTTKKGIRRGQ